MCEPKGEVFLALGVAVERYGDAGDWSGNQDGQAAAEEAAEAQSGKWDEKQCAGKRDGC